MKQHYLAVMLVLASNTQPLFREFQKILYQYLDQAPDIKIHLVFGDSADIDTANYADLVFPHIPEIYTPGMIQKTIDAMSFCEENYTYDFIVRTNLSTFWDLKQLKQRLLTYPKLNTWTGTPRGFGKHNRGNINPNFISGTDMILSQNLIPQIIEHRSTIEELTIDEDWALSHFLMHYLKLPFDPSRQLYITILEHLQYCNSKDIYKIIDNSRKFKQDHYRLKNKYDRLAIDIPVAKILLKEYYDKTLL
jgi:hypothetical protein